jgi:hypothetical protein
MKALHEEAEKKRKEELTTFETQSRARVVRAPRRAVHRAGVRPRPGASVHRRDSSRALRTTSSSPAKKTNKRPQSCALVCGAPDHAWLALGHAARSYGLADEYDLVCRVVKEAPAVATEAGKSDAHMLAPGALQLFKRTAALEPEAVGPNVRAAGTLCCAAHHVAAQPYETAEAMAARAKSIAADRAQKRKAMVTLASSTRSSALTRHATPGRPQCADGGGFARGAQRRQARPPHCGRRTPGGVGGQTEEG